MTENKSNFLMVACPECGHKHRIFNRASTEVHCTKCSAVLAKPTGGKANILGKVSKVLD